MAGGVIMIKNQKNYKIVLKTHAPVHIGSGKSIGKKEYILTSDKQAKILNLEKLLQLIAENNLFTSYYNYMCNDNNITLAKWLEYNGISQSDIDSLVDYTLDCRCTSIEQQNNIKTFMKDAYGNPYVPGSSMKGCLRTILMGCYAENKQKKYERLKGTIKNKTERELEYRENHPESKPRPKAFLKYEGNELEYTTYYTAGRKNDKPAKDRKNAVNDIMAGIIIGDSEPIKTDNLILCQKCDLRTDEEYRKQYVFNECIAPETEIVLPLTINSELCNITAEEITEAIKQFAESYYQNFVSHFSVPKHKDDYTLWLGGNVGFASKTVIYNLFGEYEGVEQTSKILTALGHYKNQYDTALGVSPHTINMAIYNDTEYHMGECSVAIVEV